MYRQRSFVQQAISMRAGIVPGSLVARIPLVAIAALVALSLLSTTQIIGADDPDNYLFVNKVINQTCINCHSDETTKGDLDLSQISWKLDDNEVRQRWIQIFDRVVAGEMPPDKKDLPDADRAQLLEKLSQSIVATEHKQTRAQGRGPIRHLTRREYENNLRDLLKLPHLDVADRLLEDRDSHGFTKVSELLDMSRVHLSGYLDVADVALRTAVASGVKPHASTTQRFTGVNLFPTDQTFGGKEAMFFALNGKMITPANYAAIPPEQRLDSPLELALFRSATWPYYGYPRGFLAKHDGLYQVRFSARAVRQLPGFRLAPAYDSLPMSFRARQPSGADVSGDVRETGGWIDLLPENKVFETTILLKAGETFEYSLLGLPVPFIRTDGGFFYDYPPMPPAGHRGATFQWLEVSGPLAPQQWPPESHRVLFGELPLQASVQPSGQPSGQSAVQGTSLGVEVLSKQPKADAQRLFRKFADRAARRPISEDTLTVFIDLIHAKLDQGDSFAAAMLKGYQAFLCSGHFLYLQEPKNDLFNLASRLSHFLWNSRPDEALLAQATAGHLSDLTILKSEVDRMISDSRFERFVTNFTDEWLNLRELRRDIPDARLYPEYRKDDYLVDSMERETRKFFAAMVKDNLPATTLVYASFTYLNDRLAAHYGLARQGGSSMRKVELPDWSPYGGLLTQASVLKLTSNGTTTSPVHRGVWVMEKLLGQPTPPPPKSVPAIEPDIRGATTIRDQLAKHTESTNCAACHARFDPVGFALENFDIMGAWRDRYRGLEQGEKITGIDRAGHPFEYRVGAAVSVAGKLLNGESFDDIRGLKQLLAANPRQLARNLLYQFTLYSTGTRVRFSDRADIERMLDNCEAKGYRVKDLLHELIASNVFLGRNYTAMEKANKTTTTIK